MIQGQALLESNDWLGGIGDQTFIAASYAEVIRDLARETGLFQQWRVVPGEADVAVYTLPAQVITIDAMVYYPTELPKTDSTALDLANPGWPIETGEPLTWLEDTQRANVFQVYPIPEVDGSTDDPLHPTQNFVTFTRDVPVDADIPPWLTGIVAIRMALRECLRLGETQDLALASVLTELSAGMTALFVHETAP